MQLQKKVIGCVIHRLWEESRGLPEFLLVHLEEGNYWFLPRISVEEKIVSKEQLEELVKRELAIEGEGKLLFVMKLFDTPGVEYLLFDLIKPSSIPRFFNSGELKWIRYGQTDVIEDNYYDARAVGKAILCYG